MNENNSVVAIYASHTTAAVATRKLKRFGFDMKKLSIVGRDNHTDRQAVVHYNTGDRMKAWGKTGAFWGGLSGFLFGAAFFWVPGFGELLMAGPLVSGIVGAQEGAVVVGCLSAIAGGLCSLGIPRDSVSKYETAIKNGKFVLIVHAATEDVTRAKEILESTNPESVNLHLVNVPAMSS